MTVDNQYKELAKKILHHGSPKEDRSRSTWTTSRFGHTLNLNNNQGFPLLTLKKTYFKTIAKELVWFLQGKTNAKDVASIWAEDAYTRYVRKGGNKTFNLFQQNLGEKVFELPSFKLFDIGELGPVYGKQWRDFNGVDQMQRAYDLLRTQPYRRDILVSAWNPKDLDKMALAPCHVMFQFDVRTIDSITYLNIMWVQRSVDVALGLPFNIASYALLQNIMARVLGYKPGILKGFLSDCHIYDEHREGMEEVIERKPMDVFPELVYSDSFIEIEQQLKAGNIDFNTFLSELHYSMFDVKNYYSHPHVKFEMLAKNNYAIST